jgi:hypothetical protein
MKTKNFKVIVAIIKRYRNNLIQGILLTGIVIAIVLQPSRLFAGGPRQTCEQKGTCKKIADGMLQSGNQEALSDYWLGVANCLNLADKEERAACLEEAKASLKEDRELAKAQFEARKDVCELLGGGSYNPVIDPNNFVDTIDNPYCTLTPGTTFIYEKHTTGETEVVEVNVTGETKVILGVTCVVVHDTATVNGELMEDTIDWYAQDTAGNVWYFGEISKQFEDGDLVSLEGSWKAGVDEAQPGIVMKANPEVNDVYRQEFSLGVAEDMSRVVSFNESVSVPYGPFDNCRETADFTPIAPDELEYKYFSTDVGQVVLTIDATTGSREELVEVLTD